MKKIIIALSIVILGGVGVYWLRLAFIESEMRPVLQCEIGRMTYYYRPECIWCQRIDREGTIAQIKELGVEVREINTRTGAVPRFRINNEIYTGYRDLEQLKELLGC